MRKLATLLATAALMTGTAVAAHADTPIYIDKCSPTITVAPNITAKTCYHASVYVDTYVSANVQVVNNSPYSLSVRADLLVGSTTFNGDTITIAPNSSDTAWGNSVTNPPGVSSTWVGRGYLSTGGWNTYTYSN